MENPLIIAGKPILHNTFTGYSPFYSRYKFRVSDATQLDIASAIGAVKRADRASLIDRQKFLKETAHNIKVDDPLIEHVVCMTGMPVSLIKDTLWDIKRIFLEIPTTLSQRFKSFGDSVQSTGDIFRQNIIGEEIINSELSRLLLTGEGFCYAVTPGNDPRATALVAANLGYLGIPFIIRASIRDAVAPLIIHTMIDAGFDPRFCNLIYMDRDTTDFEQKHFKLVDACSYVWTFGLSQSIDRTLRYQASENILCINLINSRLDPSRPIILREVLENLSENESHRRARIETHRIDHFENKVVIRHERGNCAAILNGSFDTDIQEQLYPSIGYANICTAMKSLMVIADQDQTTAIADMLTSLIVGDPLHPDTQVGYIDPRNLDYLALLLKNNALRIRTIGGERLSTFQANPLLVTSQEELPDFLGQEIPAYVLTIRSCLTTEEAVEQLNKHLGNNPRLGVSLLRLPQEQLDSTIAKIDARIILINKPTSVLLPTFHDGNDYTLSLTTGKVIYH